MNAEKIGAVTPMDGWPMSTIALLRDCEGPATAPSGHGIRAGHDRPAGPGRDRRQARDARRPRQPFPTSPARHVWRGATTRTSRREGDRSFGTDLMVSDQSRSARPAPRHDPDQSS
ncbi:hypothetical protein Raf01_59760 [Rugosimonospora africana]|uniref:Uncharacterized protein n=1 Tax=Rugosimonospora africana TaxID=556532 RepID=A0A8J3QWT3_9ACTN|nr:hypothetical protein Raf01_59760 [Rugosimonospora africana]